MFVREWGQEEGRHLIYKFFSTSFCTRSPVKDESTDLGGGGDGWLKGKQPSQLVTQPKSRASWEAV